MLRGLLQGWPKKMGTTFLTRSLPLEHPAAAPLREGTRLGASLSVKDRRLIEARLTLTGGRAVPLGILARPTFGAQGLPDLTAPERTAAQRYLKALVATRMEGASMEASAELDILPVPREELLDLASSAFCARTRVMRR